MSRVPTEYLLVVDNQIPVSPVCPSHHSMGLDAAAPRMTLYAGRGHIFSWNLAIRLLPLAGQSRSAESLEIPQKHHRG